MPSPQLGAARPRKASGALIAGICAVLAVVLVGGLATVLLLGRSSGGASFDNAAAKRAKAAANDLTKAAVALAGAVGVQYEGTYTDFNREEIAVKARLTNLGWTVATVTTEQGDVEVFSNGLRTYVKATESHWERNGAPFNKAGEYSKRWIKVSADHFDVDFIPLLTPALLGGDLGLAVERGEVTGGGKTTIDGLTVREVITPIATVYVTTRKPKRIVRIVAGSGDASSATPSPSETRNGQSGGRIVPAHSPPRARPNDPHSVPAAAPRVGSDHMRVTPVRDPDDSEFEFNLTGLSAKESADLIAELRKRVTKLKDSVDSQVRFSLDGRITLKPCTVNGCTASLAMKNTVGSSSDYLDVKQPIHARITIRITLDDKPVKTCAHNKTMEPNSSATVSCRATYTIPADGRNHEIRAHGSGHARATVKADITRMLADLKEEKARAGKGDQRDAYDKDSDLGPKWKPCSPREIPDSHSRCQDVVENIQKRLGGDIKTISPPMGARTVGPYRGFDGAWSVYQVVVKNGRVYDGWTGRHGESVEAHKLRWAWAETLRFSF